MRDCRTRGETPLHRAAAFADEATIDLLLGAKADVETRDSNGDTPLAWASWHLRPPAVLRRLCYGKHTIHPDNDATYDHWAGWGQLDMGRHSRPVF
jgi:ankyrin repeat protein